jgi:outer membrane protein TolC
LVDSTATRCRTGWRGRAGSGPSVRPRCKRFFDGSKRRASSEAATALYDGTVAEYRQTALTAFQQVEDNLAALRILDEEAQQQLEATSSAQLSLRISTDRYLGGADPYLQVLSAQTIALANQRNAVDILRRRMAASVLLIKSLGGGWSRSELPAFATAADASR